MNTLKGWISTTFILCTLVSVSVSVNAGIIVGNVAPIDQNVPCESTKTDWGIIVGNFTGIIVGNLTGIIVGNVANFPEKDCGIIVGN